ncbi:hypothetical protein [Nostoc sp.]|uniref:hypothetical protein n=1 Tax=Nostoc sp. TaxID=1180 RepID=UPI002FFCB2C6
MQAKINAEGLVPQGGSQKSKVKASLSLDPERSRLRSVSQRRVKSQNEYSVSVSLIWNGLFISAALY